MSLYTSKCLNYSYKTVLFFNLDNRAASITWYIDNPTIDEDNANTISAGTGRSATPTLNIGYLAKISHNRSPVITKMAIPYDLNVSK